MLVHLFAGYLATSLQSRRLYTPQFEPNELSIDISRYKRDLEDLIPITTITKHRLILMQPPVQTKTHANKSDQYNASHPAQHVLPQRSMQQLLPAAARTDARLTPSTGYL